jgi:hypothetical protein
MFALEEGTLELGALKRSIRKEQMEGTLNTKPWEV